MRQRCKRIALIEISTVMVSQIETVTGRKSRACARPVDDYLRGLLFFNSQADQSFALAFIAILAGIIVNLELALVLARDGRGQIQRRLLEVEISQRVFAG